jgi:predicted secreted hydrolase
MSGRLPALVLALLATVVVGACSGPVLANPPAARPAPTTAPEPTARPADPQPVVLPRDDAPHDRLTEWWYYTGHLRAEDGSRFGFEYVVFRAERGSFPVTWASHLAITDEAGDRFHYAQRAEIGPQVDRGAGTVDPAGFDFAVSGFDPADPLRPAGEPWTMAGSDGRDALRARAAGTEVLGDPLTAIGLDLRLEAVKPPALHDRDGWIDFGPAGGSYYYSRTAMDAAGTLTLGEQDLAVTGSAWFDHQWGDFISVGASGWDWFALNLDDGTDVTLSLVRAADGSVPLVYGTAVDASGGTRHLGPGDFEVSPLDAWTSTATAATYPSGWRVRIAPLDLDVTVTPTVKDQELDTRATTGVVYWEGSQEIAGTRAGQAVGGRGYVELTGYAPAAR